VDAKQYPEGVDICLVEGAICNQEHLETASLIRRRTHIVVSFGDCAGTGNVTALRNPLRKADRVLDRAYIETVDLNPRIPKEEGIVPPLLDRAIPLHERIHVDYYLVGCPPPAERIKAFVAQLIAGKEPVMTPDQIKFG
jgi:NAD-reducing hydrogenase small subunit